LPPLTQIELTTGAEPTGTVIWMHGLGADGWDFVPIVREIPLPEEMVLRFIFPPAPVRPVTLNRLINDPSHLGCRIDLPVKAVAVGRLAHQVSASRRRSRSQRS